MPPHKHLLLCGPTASGKSTLALALAEKLSWDICCLDAFQVYRGLDIGTAKPTLEDQSRVRHHLLDLVDPTDSFSVGDYLKHAASVIAEAQKDDRGLIWVGGTGLYLRALRQGLVNAPPTDPIIRAELETLNLPQLQAEIQTVDPAWAASADLQNPVRIIRALAVWRQTGRQLSAWHQDATVPLLPDSPAIALIPQRVNLQQKIRSRFNAMWQADWKQEVARLLTIPEWETSPSARAIGYTTVCQHLRGHISEAECREIVTKETLAYAKRQLTWIRGEHKLNKILVEDEFSTSALLSQVSLFLGLR